MLKKSLALAALVALAAALFTAVAAAQGTFSLSGELFHATGVQVTISCTNNKVTFRAHGKATGPYPGTFAEKGTAVLASNGNLSTASTTFSIHSKGVVIVTGSKSLMTGFGTCTNVQVNAAMLYDATQSSTGLGDSGSSQLNTSSGFFNESFGNGGG